MSPQAIHFQQQEMRKALMKSQLASNRSRDSPVKEAW